MSKKLTLEYIKQYFEEQGCELLEETYINNSTRMQYRCSCDSISKISFSRLKQGQRCMNCQGSKKYTLKYTQDYFKDNNCELLEEIYKNNRTPLKYKCSCGGISKISFNCFKRGKRCKKCGGVEKYTFKYVKQYFKDHGCKLLEGKYKNSVTKMKYKCSCGNNSKIIFDSFRKGHRCMKCAAKKRSGENSGLWNPNLTDEEREKNKNRTSNHLYIRWRKRVFKRDKYLCQKCFQKGGQLNVHHIEGYATNKELRLVDSNGITFCEKCHKKFHKIYGIKDPSKKQLEKFLY